ncbi:MAG: hypothetical protein LBP28_03800 [Coriobacteriales bacterium]|nr:hypothetical protein [Coriobacteriales bacterium]
MSAALVCLVALLVFCASLLGAPQLSWAAGASEDDPAALVSARLAAVAGTDEDITFWAGNDAEHPAYTWTFNGLELDRLRAAGLPPLDLGIALLPLALDGDAIDALELSFKHNGNLPAPATLRIALPASLGTAEALSLYRRDELSGAYELEQKELAVQGGYVSIPLTHCAGLVLFGGSSLPATVALPAPVATPASVPVATSSVPAAAAPALVTDATAAASVASGAMPASFDAGVAALDKGSFPSLPWLLSACATAAVLCAAAAACVVHRRRRKEAVAEMQAGWVSEGFTSEISLCDLPSIDELMEDLEELKD